MPIQATARRPRGRRAATGSAIDVTAPHLRVVSRVLLLPVQPREEPQHDHVRADEEHDEALDEQRQVLGQLGLEDLGIEVARRGAREQAAEEQRRERDAYGRVPAEQRDRDADERDRRSRMSSVESRNCQPSTSTAPARPANAPEIAIARK